MKIIALFGVLSIFFSGCDFLQLEEGEISITVDRILTTNQPTLSYKVIGPWDAEVILFQLDPKDPKKELEIYRNRLSPGSGTITFSQPLLDLRFRLKAGVLSERSGAQLVIPTSQIEKTFDILTNPANPSVGNPVYICPNNASIYTYLVVTFSTTSTPPMVNLRPGAQVIIEDTAVPPNRSEVMLFQKDANTLQAAFEISDWGLAIGPSHTINYQIYNLGEYRDNSAHNLTGTFSIP